MKINHRWTNACLWEGDIEESDDPRISLGRAIVKAIADEADLRRADLRGADLSWADLSWADLSWADLRRADLRGADLSWADLSGADLSWADLSGANMSGADLSWAYLSGADLSGAGKLAGVLQIGPIGSRGDILIVWFLQDGSRRYSTGCQNQITEETLLERNKNRPDGSPYRADYVAAVEFAKSWSARNVNATEVAA